MRNLLVEDIEELTDAEATKVPELVFLISRIVALAWPSDFEPFISFVMDIPGKPLVVLVVVLFAAY